MSSPANPPPSRRRGNHRNRIAAAPPASIAYCDVCQITSEDPSVVDGSLQITTLPCGHRHCNNCVTMAFNMAVRSMPFHPARCCSDIDPDILRAAVSADQIAKHMDAYLAKLEEYSCLNKLYCHVKTCSAFIPDGSRSQKVGTCPDCGRKTCKKCKGKSHWGACSADRLGELRDDDEFLALAGKQNWKQCPKCRIMVEKSMGCLHMTCICGCDFCYTCGTTLSEGHQCVGGTIPMQVDDY